MDKSQQRALFKTLNKYLPSISDIAIKCNVSASTVGYVRSGTNQNQKVIFEHLTNLKEGWETLGFETVQDVRRVLDSI